MPRSSNTKTENAQLPTLGLASHHSRLRGCSDSHTMVTHSLESLECTVRPTSKVPLLLVVVKALRNLAAKRRHLKRVDCRSVSPGQCHDTVRSLDEGESLNQLRNNSRERRWYSCASQAVTVLKRRGKLRIMPMLSPATSIPKSSP